MKKRYSPPSSALPSLSYTLTFESFRINGFTLEGLKIKRWLLFFNMLNGSTYTNIIKDFQVRAEVFDEIDVEAEVRAKVDEDKANKVKTMAQMGLEVFIETQIRSAAIGINVTITQSYIAQLIGWDKQGMFEVKTSKTSKYTEEIKEKLLQIPSDYDKIKNMHNNYIILFRIIIHCLIPREGSIDQISWDHKQIILFLVNDQKVNLAATFSIIFVRLLEKLRKIRRRMYPMQDYYLRCSIRVDSMTLGRNMVHSQNLICGLQICDSY